MADTSLATPERGTRSGDPTVAVAFGGGGARGIAHIHIIETLNAMGIEPVAISGSSIGAIMGSAMASGLSGAEIREFTLGSIGKPTNTISRMWKAARPRGVRDAMEGGLRLGQFNIERILEEFLPPNVARHFEDLKIPAKIMVTDYYDHCEVVCEKGDLRRAVAASAAIPAVFRPVMLDDRVMIDGGIFNPVPFDRLTGLADIIIGIDVVGLPSGVPGQPPSTIDMMFGASQLMMQSIIGLKCQTNPPHILLRPDVHQYRVLDFLKAREILEESAGVAEKLKQDLDAAFAFFR